MATTSYDTDPDILFGRRASGARLYRRGSRFGPPERRRLGRETIHKILYLAEALDRRTRAKGQHGGVLKGKGLDVLRALLRRFYGYARGECYPSYQEIASAAGCCRETVRRALAALEAAGILSRCRRKTVASFVSRSGRARYDVAVQTSNSYTFNFPLVDRPAYGDTALPLLWEPEAKFRSETSHTIKNTLPADLAAALAGLGTAISGRIVPTGR